MALRRLTEYARELVPRLRWYQAFLGAMGLTWDTLVQGIPEGVKLRYASETDQSGLPYLADERRVEKSPRETIEQWRGRIRYAWKYAMLMGTAVGAEVELRDAGYTTAESREDIEIGDHEDPRRWWMFILPPLPWVTGTLPDWQSFGQWDDGASYEPFLLPGEADYLRRVMRKYNPPHAKATEIVIVLSVGVCGDGYLVCASGSNPSVASCGDGKAIVLDV